MNLTAFTTSKPMDVRTLQRSRKLEQRVRRHHPQIRMIGGVDEAGRGALAGPVVVAIVLMQAATETPFINDSKMLTPSQRAQLAAHICAQALAYGVGIVSARFIDRLNILCATRLAIRKAYAKLTIKPECLFIDGRHLSNAAHWTRYPPKHYAAPAYEYQFCKGDQRIPAIAAASILAKTTRDRLMLRYHQKQRHLRVYEFAANKGYGVPVHLAALKHHGVSAVHRLSFAPCTSAMH